MLTKIWDMKSKKYLEVNYNEDNYELFTCIKFEHKYNDYCFDNLKLNEEQIESYINILTSFWSKVDNKEKVYPGKIKIGNDCIKTMYTRRDNGRLSKDEKGDYLKITYFFRGPELDEEEFSTILIDRDRSRNLYKILKSSLNHIKNNK